MTTPNTPDDFAERLARARQDDNAHRHDDPQWDDLGPYDRRILTRRAQADLDRMAEIGLRVIDLGADAVTTTLNEPNLVGLLRERVEMAAMVTDTVAADTDDTIIALFEAVCALRRATTSPADPMVQAVARALLAPEGQTTTEWCAFWGCDDPNGREDNIVTTKCGVFTYVDREHAECGGSHPGRKLARRTVTRGPWQVVTTEDGQP